ncbi:MAG TPA: hypothetical protein VFA43_23675 [Gemmatimonadaceae bacterium]|nr:hypothetical protein [Gemmatimonadaceae bacterium]
MTQDALWLLVVNALFLLGGLGVTSAAGLRRELHRRLGVSYLAGVAAYGVIAQTLFVLGVRMTRVEIVVVCLVLALGLARQRPSLRRLRIGVPGTAVVAVVVLLVVLAVDLWYQPLWAYDAWTFWTPKAHALAALGLQPAWFAQPELLNRDYPLLLPSVEAAGFRFTGYETGLLDLQSWLFVVALLGAFAELVVARAPRWAVALPTLIVVSPSIADQLAAAEADIPLAAFFACAAAFAYLWHVEGDRSSLLLFGLFCAGTAATKAEGLGFVVALALVFAVADARRRPRAALALVGTAALAVLAALGAWREWVDAHHIPQQASIGRVTDLSLLAHRLERPPIAAAYLAARLLDPRAWLVLVPLLAVLTCLLARRSRGDAVLVAGFVLLSLATLVLAYWTSQFQLHYHLETSARRVITGPLLAWAFLVPLAWGRLRADPAADPATLSTT